MFNVIRDTGNLVVMGKVLLAGHLFARFLTKRERYPLRLILSCAACLLIARFFSMPSMDSPAFILCGTFTYLVLFCAAGAGLFSCYRENGWSILFCTITGYTINQLSGAIYLLTGLRETAVNLGIFFVILFVCYVVFSGHFKKSGTIRIDNKKILWLSVLALLVDVVLGLVCIVLMRESASADCFTLLNFYNGLCSAFILFTLFSLLDNKRLELEVAVMSQMLEGWKKQYQMSKDNIEMINLKCHDLKHQIRQLRTGNAAVSGEVLREIENAVGIYDAVARTGNGALDVILTEKSLICEQAGIRLTCIADGEKLCFISPSDVYALFGNALDNAIEAVMGLSDPEQRNITLSIQAQGRLLSIHVENYFSGKLIFEDDLPQVNKEDRDYHGFGMKSMRMIVEGYGGYLTTEAQNDIFYLNIVVPIP